jgi:isopenicillin-N N-acyltransferase-like protein
VYYKEILQKLQGTSFKTTLTEEEIARFAASNPEYFDTHVHIAQYYIKHKAYAQALPFLKNAQTKVIPRKEDRDKIVKLISICNKEI